jgi:hypothetical protein
MDYDVLLIMLKQSLEIITDFMDTESRQSKDNELLGYLQSSVQMIEREGVTLIPENMDDKFLVVMYATWLYDKRKTTGSKYTSYYIQNMPRMLRYNLNNRLLQQKASETA